ncbi:MAG: DUF4097 family beta strand repeat-containing protein [Patescibacteria group bacterium]
MKKFIIVAALLFVITFVAGLIVLGKTGSFEIGGNKVEVSETKSASAAGIEKIEIEAVSERVNIIKTEGADLRADLKTSKREGSDISLVVSRDESSKMIKVKVERERKIVFFSNDWSGVLDVYLPETYTGNISAKTVSGEIESANISGLKDVSLQSVSGRIEIKGKDLGQGNLKLKTVSGRINAEQISGFMAIEAESTSGRIEFSNLTGPTNVQTISGRINLNYDALKGYIKAKSTSGKIVIDLPENADYNFNFETTSGRLEDKDKLNLTRETRTFYEGKSGDGKNEIQVKTVSGGLSIE